MRMITALDVYFVTCGLSTIRARCMKLKKKKTKKKNRTHFASWMKSESLGPAGTVAQSVERATPDEEVPGSIPVVAARSLQVGSVSV